MYFQTGWNFLGGTKKKFLLLQQINEVYQVEKWEYLCSYPQGGRVDGTVVIDLISFSLTILQSIPFSVINVSEVWSQISLMRNQIRLASLSLFQLATCSSVFPDEDITHEKNHTYTAEQITY